jgi:hypothetical protein
MARPDNQAAREQGTSEPQPVKPDQAAQAHRRLREAMEDDEAREALRSP